MNRTIQLRWLGIASIFGGACWIIGSWRFQPVAAHMQVLHALMRLPRISAPLLLAIAMLGLYNRWPAHRLRLAQWSLGCSCSGLALLLLAALGSSALTLITALGSLLLSLGLIGFGSAIMQQCQHEGWQAVPLMIGLLGLFLPIGAGIDGIIGATVSVIWGLGWMWMGSIALIEHRSLAAQRITTSRR